MSDKNDKSDDKNVEDDKSDNDKAEDSKPSKEDKYNATVANVYQWAAKLKDDIKTEASGMTYGASEKAVAMLLSKLLDGVNAELASLDKKEEDSEVSDTSTEEERNKLLAKQEKYQNMLDQLES